MIWSGKQKATFIATLMLAISIWHYSTDIHHPVLHILHRELYLLPIVFAAYWFGRKGGLTASIIASLLFLPLTFMGHQATATNQLDNVLDLLMFNCVAYLLGKYRDVQRARYTTFWRPETESSALQPSHRRVLLVIDNSVNAAKTARYVVESYGKNPDMTVTILGFIREPSLDLFANRDEFREAKELSEETIAYLVADAHQTLLSGGFPQEAISVKTIRIGKETIASKLLDEQNKVPYHSIVVGGAKISKAEEFIFGNLAVKLVRESNCPVVTVY